jgi:hypothetical protein
MKKPTYIFDIEVFKDYFLVGFRNARTGSTLAIEMHDGHPLDIEMLSKVMSGGRLVSFNGKRFDAPLVALALTGATCEELKVAANTIISDNLQPWQFEDRFPCRVDPTWDHVDLFDVSPGMVSLKIYAGRMHSKRLQDLPIEHDASIDASGRAQLRDYCLNSDCVATLELLTLLTPQIELRERMTAEYGIDLRSKSDAQIAEAVIKSQVSRLVKHKVERPILPPGTTFHYVPPAFISFDTPVLRQALEVITSTTFSISRSGSVIMPPEIDKLRLKIGSSTYKMGIGGLHSTESCVSHRADDWTYLIDRDVVSYYPAIILNCELYPRHLGPVFLDVYRDIVQRRLAAKKAGDKVTADALKITINGTFGKLGSMWSTLYAPDLLIQTTVTGQLSLLMLIEALELAGVAIVSANTDGIVIKCPSSRAPEMDAVVAAWEMGTGFETEATQYDALFSRDVNNYIAVKRGGGWKAKGAFSPAGVAKNPTNEICSAAVRALVVDGTPIEKTIGECDDLRRFVSVRNVNGGCVDQQGNLLGRAARWYYSTQVTGPLQYRVNGYKVSRSEGGRPLMTMLDKIPDDLDREWYVREAYAILGQIGFDLF